MGLGIPCLWVLASLSAGCAHGRPETPASASDPVADIVARSQAHLERGLALAESGEVEQARVELDRSVDLFLEAPGGALADRRLANAYKHTVETVHAREIEALATDDEGGEEEAVDVPPVDTLTSLAVDETPASPETRQRATEAVAGEANDIPVELNDAVLSCIGLYQGPLHDWFGAALARGGRYLPFIRAVLASEGLPQDLAYLALVESAFKPRALSRAKARGVWQFIPSTGRRFGLRQTWWIDERSDPEKATRAAARYLKELHDLLGSWDLAMAGYNAGENNVLRAVRRHGTSDFWILRRTGSLRRETSNYVPMIHAAIVVAKAPKKYGFDVEPEAPLQLEHVPLRGPVDLRAVAACADTTVPYLRDLNPSLRRLTTPPRESFDIKVPRGSGADVLECMDGLSPGRRTSSFLTHTVTRGETLSSMSRRYGASVSDIAAANGMSVHTTLYVGTQLIVPVRSGEAGTVRRASSRRPTSVQREAVRHVILPGDTLGAIARRYGTTVRALRRWNGLRDSRIAAGEELLVYPQAQF